VVEDRQLSLAIGKKGQNVRLAAKLTGWKIDIKSEEERRKEVEATLAGIEFGGAGETARPLSLPGIHVEVVTVLKNAGYDTAERILEASREALAALPGFDAETVEAVRVAAEAERATSPAPAPGPEEPAAHDAPEGPDAPEATADAESHEN
jgi:N utilization substance protein A